MNYHPQNNGRINYDEAPATSSNPLFRRNDETLNLTHLAAVGLKSETPTTTTAIQRAPPHLPSCDVLRIRTKRIQKNLHNNKNVKSDGNSDNTKHHPLNHCQRNNNKNPSRKQRDGGLMKTLAEELYTTEQACFDVGDLESLDEILQECLDETTLFQDIFM
jgi:hypothetical protein